MLENIIPRILIEKITLESREQQISLDINPHIDHEREPGMTIDPETGKLRREIVSSNFEKKTRPGSGKLSVTLDLTMVETIGDNDNDLSLWFSDFNLIKYFRVRALCSETKDGTDKILSSYEDLTKFYQPGILSKEVSLEEVVKQFAAGERRETTTSDGKTVYEIPFKVSFAIDSYYPQHLSTFVIPYFDAKGLGEEFGFGSGTLNNVQGVVAAETLIEDGKVVSNSYYFVDGSGQLWTGPVTGLADGRYVSGYEQTEDSIPLFIRTVSSTKIQDFRDIRDLEKRIVDFGLVDDSLTNRVNSIASFANSATLIDIGKNRAYLTDLSLARDEDGNARFLFGIDILKVARENLLFGKLVREDTIDDIGRHLLIKSLKIKRVRVKDSKDAIKDSCGLSRFDKNDSEDLIAYSGESSPGRFLIGDKSTNGVVREVFLPTTSSERFVRYFTGMDKNMSKVTFGVYQYGVEIEFEDRTLTVFYEKLRALSAAYEALKQYYSVLTTPGNFFLMSDVATPAFAAKMETKWPDRNLVETPWVTAVIAYLDVASLLFEDIDTEKLAKVLIAFSDPRTGTVSSVGRLLSLVETLLSKFANLLVTKMSVGKRLSNMNGSSRDSKIRSRSNLPSRTFHYEKYFTESFDSDLPKKVGFDFLSTNSSQGAVNSDGLYVVSNLDYGRRVEEETLKYFTTLEADITIQNQGQMIVGNDKLANEQFAYVTPSIIKMNDAMRITTLGQGAGLFDEKKYNVMATEIAKFNFLKQSPQILPKAFVASEASMLGSKTQQMKDNINTLIINKGIEVRPVTKMVVLDKMIEINEEEKGKLSGFYVPVETLLGTGSLINKEGLLKDNMSECGASLNNVDNSKATNINPVMMKMFAVNTTRPASRIGKFEQTKAQKQTMDMKRSINFYDIRSKDNLVDHLSTRAAEKGRSLESVKETIRALPNQIKSLLVSSVNSAVVRKDWLAEQLEPISSPVQAMMFKMNYDMIKQVDVFAGFEQDAKGALLIGQPKWEKMTQEKFNESVGRIVLCRMKPYVNQEVGIFQQKAIELPMFNEYFLLSPTDKIQDVQPPKSSSQKVEKMREHAKTIVDSLKDDREKFASSLAPIMNKTETLKDQRKTEKTIIDSLIDDRDKFASLLAPVVNKTETLREPKKELDIKPTSVGLVSEKAIKALSKVK